ncbi:MAG: hypothetical protein WC536_00415 [Patescibacteria group bacterium]
MKLRLEEKREAIKLRRDGYSYNEIRQIIPDLSKGTLSGWLKNIELNSVQKARIISKINSGAAKGRIKGAWTNKNKAIDRIKRIKLAAAKEFDGHALNPIFSIFLSLYWAEGAKKSRCFQFVNSDPEMVKIVLKCLRTLFNIPEEEIKIRIFIHEVYSNENCEEFWSKITNIPISSFKKTVYKPTIHNIKKNIDYKGCCRLELKGSEFYWKVQKWIDMMILKCNN